jgi:hypothetical protein
MLTRRTMSDMAGPRLLARCSWRLFGQWWNSRPLRRGVGSVSEGGRICGHLASDGP